MTRLVSVRLKNEIYAGLRQRADKDGVTISEMINRACEKYLTYKVIGPRLKPIVFMTKKPKSTVLEVKNENG